MPHLSQGGEPGSTLLWPGTVCLSLTLWAAGWSWQWFTGQLPALGLSGAYQSLWGPCLDLSPHRGRLAPVSEVNGKYFGCGVER